MKFRPPACDGCICNPKSDNFRGHQLIGEFVPINENGNKILIPGDGSFNIDLYILAMAPAQYEEEEDEPLVGPSGRMVDQQISRWQLPIKKRKANLVNCRTKRRGTTTWVARDPTAAEIRDCASRWLLAELAELEKASQRGNDIILWTLGQLPFDKVFRKYGKFKDGRGTRLERNPNLRSFLFLMEALERLIKRTSKRKKLIETTRFCKGGCGKEIKKPRLKCDACRTTGKKKEKKCPTSTGNNKATV